MADFLGLDVADTERSSKSRLDALIDIIHPDDAAEFRDSLGRCLITGEPFSMSYRLRRADGAYRSMSGRAEPMRDQLGRAHVCTPVTNAHLVCRIRREKTKMN